MTEQSSARKLSKNYKRKCNKQPSCENEPLRESFGGTTNSVRKFTAQLIECGFQLTPYNKQLAQFTLSSLQSHCLQIFGYLILHPSPWLHGVEPPELSNKDACAFFHGSILAELDEPKLVPQKNDTLWRNERQ